MTMLRCCAGGSRAFGSGPDGSFPLVAFHLALPSPADPASLVGEDSARGLASHRWEATISVGGEPSRRISFLSLEVGTTQSCGCVCACLASPSVHRRGSQFIPPITPSRCSHLARFAPWREHNLIFSPDPYEWDKKPAWEPLLTPGAPPDPAPGRSLRSRRPAGGPRRYGVEAGAPRRGGA